MKTSLLVLILLLVGCISVVHAEEPDEHTYYFPIIVKTPSPPRQDVLRLINQHRAKVGCPPVKFDSRLNTAAQLHAEDQAAHDYFSHIGRDGSNAGDRIRRQGYDWKYEGEIMALGVGYKKLLPAKPIMDSLIGSKGHREIIEECFQRDVGVGATFTPGNQHRSSRQPWVINFGRHK